MLGWDLLKCWRSHIRIWCGGGAGSTGMPAVPYASICGGGVGSVRIDVVLRGGILWTWWGLVVFTNISVAVGSVY